jgi:GNAT superfamily N-acetyltransferase
MPRPAPEVAVRPAIPGDASALARLRYEFRAGLAPVVESEAAFVARCEPWMAQRLACGTWSAWVATADGEMVGTVWLQLVEKLPNPVAEPERHGYLTSCYVRARYRNAGVGTALLEAALGECDRRACDAVILWPTPESRSLYERHGFAVRDDTMERRR